MTRSTVVSAQRSGTHPRRDEQSIALFSDTLSNGNRSPIKRERQLLLTGHKPVLSSKKT
jgi:hypothetical protein